MGEAFHSAIQSASGEHHQCTRLYLVAGDSCREYTAVLVSRNIMRATNANRGCGLEFSSSHFKKLQEIGDIIFDNLFYLTQFI